MLLGWDNLAEVEQEELLRSISGTGPVRGPYHIEFDWTDRCNVDCFFCNSAVRNLAGQELDPELVNRTLAECKSWGLKSVRLSGGGEPLFHSRLGQLLESIRYHEIPIEELTTNGILLTQENCDRLLAAGLQRITLSLNYADEESYAIGMRSTRRNFYVAQEGVRRLLSSAVPQGNRKPHLVVAFAVTHRTRGDIPKMYELGLALGADQLAFRDLAEVDREEAPHPEDLPGIRNDLQRILEWDGDRDRLVFRFGEPGLGSIRPPLEGLPLRKKRWVPTSPKAKKRMCIVPWYSLAVRGNGSVYPCCNLLLDCPYEPLGNLNETSLLGIWRGPAFEQLRREMLETRQIETEAEYDERGFKRLHPICALPCACPLRDLVAEEAFHEKVEELEEARQAAGASGYLAV